MAKLDTELLGIKTFLVELESNKKLIIKPSSWQDLEDIQILQYKILETCWECNGSTGDIFNSNNKDFWESACDLAKLLPVVGKGKGFFNPREVEDIDELVRVFITNTIHRDESTGFITPGPDDFLLPSEISRVNGINFTRLLTNLLKNQEKKLSISQTSKKS